MDGDTADINPVPGTDIIVVAGGVEDDGSPPEHAVLIKSGASNPPLANEDLTLTAGRGRPRKPNTPISTPLGCCPRYRLPGRASLLVARDTQSSQMSPESSNGACHGSATANVSAS